MKKIQRKFNLAASVIFLIGAFFLYDYINAGKWKYIGPCLLVLLAYGNLMISFEKYTDHEKRYPAGTGAIKNSWNKKALKDDQNFLAEQEKLESSKDQVNQ